MVSGLVSSANGRDGFSADSGVGDNDYQDLSGTQYAALNITDKVFYFSGDYSKDGSRKTGYQKVDFDDDTYEMYFNNNGEAANDYVSKIKKYAKNGIVLKANNDDSNYGGIAVQAANPKKLAVGGTGVKYYDVPGSLDGQVLVNTAGSVQTSKTNLKDSNDIYYATDKNGVVLYSGAKKLYTVSNTDHPVAVTVGTKTYYTE